MLTAAKAVREVYVRRDLSCRSAACAQHGADHPCLAADASHYVMPDVETTLALTDLVEHDALANVILCETLLDAAQTYEGTRMYRRIRKLANNPQRTCLVFPNEKCAFTHYDRQPHQRPADRNFAAILKTAMWYADHLDRRVPIVVLSDQPWPETAPSPPPVGVSLMTPEAYLHKYFADYRELHDLLASLRSIPGDNDNRRGADESTAEDGLPYPPHKSTETLEAGIKSMLYYSGKLRVMSTSNEAVVLGAYHGQNVVVLGNQHRNRAMHGDTVVVELLPTSQWQVAPAIPTTVSPPQVNEDATALVDTIELQPTGRVVGIRIRSWRPYVATLQPTEQTSGHVLAVPMDLRIPKIRIHVNDTERFMQQRLVVRIHSWSEQSMYPNGHFLRTIGPVDHLDTEVEAVLVENEIAISPFSTALLQSMPVNTREQPWTITQRDLAERRDLRASHTIFSIDPKGSEDIDDALSACILPNGNVELGVHIADVSAFVTPGCLADLEARHRGTTVYLADRRFNMLPAILSEDLCSLRGNCDRFAVTVLAEIDVNAATVVSTWFGRTVIRSVREMYYEQAQAMLDQSDGLAVSDTQNAMLAELPADFRARGLPHLLRLRDVCRRLRMKRLSEGALELSGTEVRFKMAPASPQEVMSLVTKTEIEINRIVAEAMILANALVAEKITSTFPALSLLRRHPIPPSANFCGLERLAQILVHPPEEQVTQIQSLIIEAEQGHSLSTRTNADLAASLDTLADAQANPVAGNLIRSLAVTAMTEAEYFCTGDLGVADWYHYGLALPRYTHFTSPIRRYADILVHRTLLAACAPSAHAMPTQSELSDLAAHLNKRNRASKASQRDCTELFQALYVKHALKHNADRPLTVDAIVFDIRDRHLLVFVPRLGFRAPVYLQDKNGAPGNVTPSIFGTAREALEDHLSELQIERVSPKLVRLTSGPSTVDLALFDQVEVHLTLTTTFAHRPTIILHLARKRTPTGSTHTGTNEKTERFTGRHSLMSAILQHQEAGEHQSVDATTITCEPSVLYKLFEQMRIVAQERDGDDDASENHDTAHRRPPTFVALGGGARRIVGKAVGNS